MSDLSPESQRLVRFMQRLNFGSIHLLLVREGEPVLSPMPTIIREVKLGAANTPRPESDLGDFALRDEVRDLFRAFREQPDMIIETITVRHGLPVQMSIEAPGDGSPG